MKVTVLDKISFTVGDIDLSSLDALGEVEYYDVLRPEEIIKVCRDSEVIVCNKTLFTKDILECLPKLKGRCKAVHSEVRRCCCYPRLDSPR